jgi:hypothetical protein
VTRGKRHPIRGLFGGLFLGLSLMILAMMSGMVLVASPASLGIIAGGIALGLVSSFVLPAKKPKA